MERLNNWANTAQLMRDGVEAELSLLWFTPSDPKTTIS